MSSQNSPESGTLLDQLRGLSRRTIILWLVAASLILLFIPLSLIVVVTRDDSTRLENELQNVQSELAGMSTPAPEVQELMDVLAQVQSSANEIEEARTALAASHVDWPSVMMAIGNYNPNYLALTSLAQADSRITLEGQAVDNAAVTTYHRALEESGLFSRVILQSVRTVATPFAATTVSVTETPGAIVTSTAAITPTVTLTPTPSPSDEYETDDFEPKDIFLGQPQRHNFHPVYDVDKVKFLAKSGRWYRVFTSDLSPGVDTSVTADVGGVTYTNDDRGPRDLSSEIIFQVGSGYDVDVVVKVTNRGQYGPEMWYQITAEEIIPTPTPEPTGTPLPTLTPLSTASPEPTGQPPVLTQITPDSASTGDGVVEVTIIGSGFYGVPRVFLTGVAADIEATGISVTAGWRINCEFDLSGKQPGVWDVVVVNPDDQVGVLPGAFVILGTSTLVPTETFVPTETLTPTEGLSASSSVPMAVSLSSGWSLGCSPYLMAGQTIYNLDAVEFVIILELKRESP